MSFSEKILALAELAQKHRTHLLTEEAVKTSIVLPMFQALEFNPFDPHEVVPEFIADVGIKKGEKVDYALKIHQTVSILVECKSPTVELDLKHASQLYRYFSVTDARFAILTNGFDWEFYTDLDHSNKMDSRPFLSFNLAEIDRTSIAELERFKKSEFNVERILSTATDLKYVSAIKKHLKSEFDDPSNELVSLLGKRVYEGGRFTAQLHEQFSVLIKRSFSEVLREKVNARLSSALAQNMARTEDEDSATDVSEIETTEEEWDGFRIAIAIASRVIEPSRITIRDQRSYCGVLIDNNNRKPLLRMWFNSPKTKYLGLFDGETEEKVSVSSPVDLYKFSDRICKTAEKYLT